MKKTILIIVCCIFCFVNMTSVTFAAQKDESTYLLSGSEDLNNCTTIALYYMNDDSKQLVGISNLYNSANELIAYCVNFEPCGYIIITIDDYIPQVIARDHVTPFPVLNDLEGYKYVYGGAMNYWLLDDEGIITDIESGDKHEISEVREPFRVCSNKYLRNKSLSIVQNNDSSSNSRISSSVITGYTRHNPSLWANSYTCGLQAVTIIIGYLHDYHSLMLPSSLNSWSNLNGKLQPYLRDNDYLPDYADGFNGSQIVNGSFLHLDYKGINEFFKDNGNSIRGTDKSFSSNTISNIINSINNDYPAMLGSSKDTDFNVQSYNEHWFVVYGYKKYEVFSVMIVNDGRGHDGIELNALMKNFEEAILFY